MESKGKAVQFLEEHQSGDRSTFVDDAKWRQENASWLKQSQCVACVNYADIPIPQFVDIILKGDDEAMYYLLHERLKHLLFERNQDYSHNLYDDFDDLLDDFSNLYPILFGYYIQCIDTLKTSDAVKELRSQYIEERGFVVHEPSVPEQSRISIVRFWVKLNRWLIPGMMAM